MKKVYLRLVAAVLIMVLLVLDIDLYTVSEGYCVSPLYSTSGNGLSGNIAPKPVSNLVFNGYEQELIVGGRPEKGNYVYSFNQKTGFKREIPKAKKAGAYNIYYKLENTANCVDAPLTVVIDRKMLDEGMLLIENRELEYTGQFQRITFDFKDDNILSSDYVVTGNFAGIEVGEYEVKISATETGNYKGSFTFKWSITDKNNNPDEDPNGDDDPVLPDDDDDRELFDEVVLGGQKTLIYSRFRKDIGISGYRLTKEGKKLGTVSKSGVLKPKKKNGIFVINGYKEEKVHKKKVKTNISRYTVKVVTPSFDKSRIKTWQVGDSVSMNDVIKGLEDIPKGTQKVSFGSSNKKVAGINPETQRLEIHKKGYTSIYVKFTNKDKKTVKYSILVKIKKKK